MKDVTENQSKLSTVIERTTETVNLIQFRTNCVDKTQFCAQIDDTILSLRLDW